ncbi:MAG: hypothetical protein AAF957_03565 [Planctomycetota bacterium]
MPMFAALKQSRTRLVGTAGLALAFALSTATSATAADLDDLEIDHVGLARTVLDRAGLSDVPPEEVSMETLLAESFYTLRLGLYDLAISAHETDDKHNGNDFALLGVALIDVQAAFLEWVGPKAPDLKQAEKDIKTLRSWVKGLRGDIIENLDHSEMGDLATLLGAPKKVLEAQERFGKYMAKGTPLGLDREDELVDPFIVAPDRRAFLELLSTFGMISPQNQEIYWKPEVAEWTNTYFNDVSVVALQFADVGSTTMGAFGGISMNSRTPTGMQQQIAQLAGNALVDNLYGSKIPPSLAGAFAVNLVIDIYGECNTRVDGDLRARRTEAREVFVPGGQSEGGVLPPNLADSRWRGEQGKDRFLVALLGAQKAGESKVRKRSERTCCFELRDDREAQRIVVRAPFLGTPAVGKDELPESFYGDRLEFFRSYRTGFVFWLQTQGLRSKSKARAAFADFLRQLAQADDNAESLETVIQEVYGSPLSADQTSKDDLEGQFLKWLSKQ